MKMKKKATALIVSAGAAGALAGGVLMGTLSANAADSGSSSGSSGSTSYAASGTRTPGQPPVLNGNTDPSKPMRSDEKLLTGETKDKVTAAVKAAYPKATFQRVETDSDGVYEAHVLLDGKPVIVQVDASYQVTGTQSMPAPGGDHDGDGPAGQAPAGQAPAA